MDGFAFNRVITGDSREALASLPPESVDLSFWSPPYFVGKSYERHLSFKQWKDLLRDVIALHAPILRKGGFMAVNIADILCFSDENMPRFQADNISGKKVSVTKERVKEAMRQNPDANRRELAEILGCSEQTVQRRMEGNNARGGKSSRQTKVLLTGQMIAEWAEESGLCLYDQRIWRKDPCWANSRWHAASYRAVDEFEHIYVFWKPGVTEFDRRRLEPDEWAAWGSRGVWDIGSVRANGRHEAEFPEALAERVIRLFSPEGGVVIDPFLGSGTTAVAAKRCGRKWLGIDLEAQHTRTARERINAA